MPQLEQINSFSSQIFWLFVTFGLIYLFIVRYAVPRLTDIMNKRQTIISTDIEKADEYKDESEEITTKLEKEIAQARSKSLEVTQEASQKASKNYNESFSKALADVDDNVDSSIAEIDAKKEKVFNKLDAEITSYVNVVLEKVSDITATDAEIRKVINS